MAADSYADTLERLFAKHCSDLASANYVSFGLAGFDCGDHLALRCEGRPQDQIVLTEGPDERAAAPLLDLALDPGADPHLYGELVQAGKVLPWKP